MHRFHCHPELRLSLSYLLVRETLWGDLPGVVCLLAQPLTPHRVLGFGTLTPEPGAARAHRAVLDLVVHDQYSHGASSLLESLLAESRARKLQAVQTYIAESDQTKIGPF